MKVKELIEVLEGLKALHGNIEICSGEYADAVINVEYVKAEIDGDENHLYIKS